MKKQTVFKCRRTDTNEYLTRRGSYPTWNDTGAVYLTRGAIKSALKTRRLQGNMKGVYRVIEEYELVKIGSTRV